MDELLPGGRFSQPVRRGDTVQRRRSTANTHALLRHFEAVGFDLAPRLVDVDTTSETLTYLPGATGYPPLSADLRSDEALVSVARAIRRLHDATEGFVPAEQHSWNALEVAAPVTIDCIGHHDLAPWNLVFEGRQVTGIIDWDTIRPSNRRWDLAYTAHQFVPFHPPASLEPFGWTSEPERARRLRLFCDSYDAGVEPAELVDLAAIRLLSFGAHIEERVRAGDPVFAVHADEDHAGGYRAAAAYLLAHRAELLQV
ncbi:aminoglycoside phosphotransferase family protein [Kribbella sindirgiensis]|uniref:Aminoglycoside phosphotransferase family protein n=1 Tax=Kribbella sindirgiensis TaxID=1124744 RepID=A0A4R0IX11_9ACTN|nr:aminoglycoside phosphotransferase family protein [Kribbella sindirgiensis]TCC33335.1 aminoglycoside phosphotransferase family protein [Kribbella sindirgiensis]